MDVGCWLLKTTSANLLKNCINPVWGLVYSNGASVFLLPISSVEDQSYLHPKLLKLENVGLIHDISCSPCYLNIYYVAVISSLESGLRVSIWEALEGELQKPFTRVKDAYICGNPLPQGQGLAWHPLNNIICTVCHNEAFIFNNETKKSSLEKIKSFSGTERFTSCCWNYSGSLLIFATHSKLLFYNFSYDVTDQCEPVFSFVIGRVCSLETVDQTRLLCAIELPLSDVLRHQVDTSSHDAPTNSPLEHLMNVSSTSNSIVASSQLLLIGYNAIDGKPYIMTRIDIEEILTPNIMVYEKTNGLCIVASNCSSKLQFYAVDKIPITKIAEMILENGKVPKGVSISTFNNTKLLWLLSGQSCKDCAAVLSIPDSGYISCNMTFRVIALKSLLGPEKRFIVQEKDFDSCLSSWRATPKFCSESRIRLPDRTKVPDSNISLRADIVSQSTLIKKSDSVPAAVIVTAPAKKKFCDKATEVNFDKAAATTADAENDDNKSVLSYYSADSNVMPKKTGEFSSSNEEYYSIGQYSGAHAHRDKRAVDLEKCFIDMFEKHTMELNDIKAELRELKRVVSGISTLPLSTLNCATSPPNTELLCHIQELQDSVHVVENKVDSMSIDINSKMKHQDRKLSELKRELNILIGKHK